MSFDVYLVKPACSACGNGRESVHDFNITHNVNQIVERCIASACVHLGTVVTGKELSAGYVERSWGRLNGWRARDVLPVLERALIEAFDTTREQEFHRLEPDNGWGSLNGVRETLSRFVEACRENPDATIEANG